MEIKSSIRILFQLATKAKWISETELVSFFNKEYLNQLRYSDKFYDKLPFQTSISSICQNYLVIYCCSFLDEYERVFNPSQFPNDSKKIIEFKKVVLPAYKRIKKWKDIKKLRNSLIAHNHRIKGKSIFDHDTRIKYNVPSTNEEFTLLADLIFLIAEQIHLYFPETVSKMDLKITLKDHIAIESDKLHGFEEFKRIKKEIEKNKNCS
jgi:hypothetical protein